jgi:hypothetical protein
LDQAAGVRENGLRIDSPPTSYVSELATSGGTVALEVLLGLIVALALIPLVLGLAPAPALAAFSDRLLLYRTELAFLGVAMLLGVAIGFATLLLGGW